MNLYQVTLSLPVEAESPQEAAREFKWSVESGPDYVYRVDGDEGNFLVDAENDSAREPDAPEYDILAQSAYLTAHGATSAESLSAHDRELIKKISKLLQRGL